MCSAALAVAESATSVAVSTPAAVGGRSGATADARLIVPHDAPGKDGATTALGPPAPAIGGGAPSAARGVHATALVALAATRGAAVAAPFTEGAGSVPSSRSALPD